MICGVEFVHKVWLGTPFPYFITTEIGKNNTLYPFQPELNNGEAIWIGGGDPILEYDWQVPYWTITPYYANKSFVRFNVISQTTVDHGSINIRIRARNKCGWGAWSGYIKTEVYPYPLHKMYTVYKKNPSTLVIVKENGNLSMINDNVNILLDYELYNQGNGMLAAKGQINRKGGSLDFSKLPKGIYILSLILDSNHRDTHKVVL